MRTTHALPPKTRQIMIETSEKMLEEVRTKNPYEHNVMRTDQPHNPKHCSDSFCLQVADDVREREISWWENRVALYEARPILAVAE